MRAPGPHGPGLSFVDEQPAILVPEPRDQRRRRRGPPHRLQRERPHRVDQRPRRGPGRRARGSGGRRSRAGGCGRPEGGSRRRWPVVPRPVRTWARRRGPTRRAGRSRAGRRPRGRGWRRASPCWAATRGSPAGSPTAIRQAQASSGGWIVSVCSARARGDVVEERAQEGDRLAPEDRVADEAVRALGRKQALELGPGPVGVEAAPDDRRETGVPVPLPGVAAGARLGVGEADPLALALLPVLAQDALGLRRDRCRCGGGDHGSRAPSIDPVDPGDSSSGVEGTLESQTTIPDTLSLRSFLPAAPGAAATRPSAGRWPAPAPRRRRAASSSRPQAACSCRAIGRPSERPTGTLIAGIPVRLASAAAAHVGLVGGERARGQLDQRRLAAAAPPPAPSARRSRRPRRRRRRAAGASASAPAGP